MSCMVLQQPFVMTAPLALAGYMGIGSMVEIPELLRRR